MLMEYFTYEELKDIKKKVIAQHCSQKDTAELLRGLSLWNQAEERQKFFKYSVDEKSDKGEIATDLLVSRLFAFVGMNFRFCLRNNLNNLISSINLIYISF